MRWRTVARLAPLASQAGQVQSPIIVSGQAHMCNAQLCPAVVYVADVLPSTLINQLDGAS